MPKFIDMSGKRFGRLVVTGQARSYRQTSTGKPVIVWNCLCDCGSQSIVTGYSLRNGHTQSCGCYNNDVITSHAMTKTRTYKTWGSMRQRCLNPNSPDYGNYGGRGIVICDRWSAFEAFLEDMGERPIGHSIERIDNEGPYCPENCRWATTKEQGVNRRSARLITIDGVTKCLMDWCEGDRDRYFRAHSRIGKGWTPKYAISAPAGSRKR